MYKLSVDPELAPDEAQYIELSFEKGNCIAIDGIALTPSQVVVRTQQNCR